MISTLIAAPNWFLFVLFFILIPSIGNRNTLCWRIWEKNFPLFRRVKKTKKERENESVALNNEWVKCRENRINFFSFVHLTLLLHRDCCSNDQVLADLVAPSNFADWNGTKAWISFSHINGLIVEGMGRVGGQGSIWWPCKLNSSVCNQSLYVSLQRICFLILRYHLKKLYTKTRSACIYVYQSIWE